MDAAKYLGSNIIGSSTGCMQQTILLQVNKRILKYNQLTEKYCDRQVRVESMESTLKHTNYFIIIMLVSTLLSGKFN